MIVMLRNGHIGQVYLLIAFLEHGCIYAFITRNSFNSSPT